MGIELVTARQCISEGAHVAITGASQATLEAARAQTGKGRPGNRVRRR
jgi:hypothetical protein